MVKPGIPQPSTPPEPEPPPGTDIVPAPVPQPAPPPPTPPKPGDPIPLQDEGLLDPRYLEHGPLADPKIGVAVRSEEQP